MLVSAVMPTRGRQRMAIQAVDVFLSQTYQDKELVILDDLDCPSFPNPEVLKGVGIQYHIRPAANIPQKRNMLTHLASGDYIMNLDSDDWSAPNRMELQLNEAISSGKAVTGFSAIYFYDTALNRASFFRPRPLPYALGSSLFFKREWALTHRFLETKRTGSDNAFIYEAAKAKQFHSVPGIGMMVARHHADCTNRERKVMPYGEVELSRLPAAFLELEQGVPA